MQSAAVTEAQRRFARQQWRARIETYTGVVPLTQAAGFARQQWRARIET